MNRMRKHPVFSALVSPAEKNLFFGGREATTGNTSAVRRIQHHMPIPKFLKLYPTQKKRAYAPGIVLYNRNIFFRTTVFSSRSGKWLPSPFNLLFNIIKRLCLHLDFLIRLQALPPALITKYLNES